MSPFLRPSTHMNNFEDGAAMAKAKQKRRGERLAAAGREEVAAKELAESLWIERYEDAIG